MPSCLPIPYSTMTPPCGRHKGVECRLADPYDIAKRIGRSQRCSTRPTCWCARSDDHKILCEMSCSQLVVRCITTIMLSGYPASRAQSERSLQHIARAAHSSMKRKDRASNQLDTITPRAWRALDCEHSPHKRARCVTRERERHTNHTRAHNAKASEPRGGHTRSMRDPRREFTPCS